MSNDDGLIYMGYNCRDNALLERLNDVKSSITYYHSRRIMEEVGR
jgi:hypothetical protein